MVKSTAVVKRLRQLNLKKARLCKKLVREKDAEVKSFIRFQILVVDSNRKKAKHWEVL